MATTCASPRPPARSCNTRCARWSARWCMSAKANGAPTILPRRSPPATAPPAARSRRRMGFIWCGWSIEACVSLSPLAGRGEDDSPEILLDDPPIHRGERDQIGDRGAFVDAVHGLADQAEFQHRAIILDEACVRGAAGGRELRRAPGHFSNGGRGEIGEWAGLCDEDVGVRRQPVEGIVHAAGSGIASALLD